jgi:hypothetical protein
MQRIIKTLQVLGLCCFGVFVACALVTASTGLLMIWDYEEGDFEGALWLTFLSAFLLTVVTGLLVSGTRSMIGVAVGGEGDDRAGAGENAAGTRL